MSTLDVSLPASADFSSASSLARFVWLKLTEPASATGAAALVPAELDASEPPALLEQPAAASERSTAVAVARVRDLLVRSMGISALLGVSGWRVCLVSRDGWKRWERTPVHGHAGAGERRGRCGGHLEAVRGGGRRSRRAGGSSR